MNTRTTADFTNWVFGQAPAAQHMLALYESDFVVRFAVDNMNEDAFSKWLKDFEEPNPAAPIAPTIQRAAKWADLFGDSIAVLYSAATTDGDIKNFDILASKFSGTAAGLDAFHPLVDGDGYEDPSPADLDERGHPKWFWVHVKGAAGVHGASARFKIDISRCVIFKGKATRRSWRGQYVGIASLDDTISYRKWRAAYGVRAFSVAEPTYHLDKPAVGAEFTATEKTSIDAAFGVDKAALTTGGVTISPISTPLSIGELDSTAIGLLNAIANDLGVQLNDLFQHQGNAEKIAPDNNQTSYIQAILERQAKHTDSITKVLTAFGLEFSGWNSPWEEPFSQQLANINTLANIMNTSMDPETRAIAKSLLVTTYGEKTDYVDFLDEQRGTIEREQQQLDALTRGGDSGSGFSHGGDKPGKASKASKKE